MSDWTDRVRLDSQDPAGAWQSNRYRQAQGTPKAAPNAWGAEGGRIGAGASGAPRRATQRWKGEMHPPLKGRRACERGQARTREPCSRPTQLDLSARRPRPKPLRARPTRAKVRHCSPLWERLSRSVSLSGPPSWAFLGEAQGGVKQGQTMVEPSGIESPPPNPWLDPSAQRPGPRLLPTLPALATRRREERDGGILRPLLKSLGGAAWSPMTHWKQSAGGRNKGKRRWRAQQNRTTTPPPQERGRAIQRPSRSPCRPYPPRNASRGRRKERGGEPQPYETALGPIGIREQAGCNRGNQWWSLAGSNR